MVAHDRIQCGVQLKKKRWSGPEDCFVCDKPESTDHIIFQCPMAMFLWAFLRDSLGWPSSPTSVSSLFLEIIDRGGGAKQTQFLCAGVMWSVWKARINDVVFNKKALN